MIYSPRVKTMFILRYSSRAIEDVSKITKKYQIIIQRSIEDKLQKSPHIYGKSLRGSLTGKMSLRVGDYRIIFEIVDKKEVHIWMVGHRKEVYDEARKRFAKDSYK